MVLAPDADEAKLPDQVVEGGPEIVGYIPDDDSDSADGIFRDGCCRPEYKARPVARCFTPLLGSRLPKTVVWETESSGCTYPPGSSRS